MRRINNGWPLTRASASFNRVILRGIYLGKGDLTGERVMAMRDPAAAADALMDGILIGRILCEGVWESRAFVARV